MRRTRIVATLGPSTDDPQVLDGLIAAGVDVVRLNAAHGTVAHMDTRLGAVRAAAARCGRQLGVLVDLAGPKIRVGDMAPGTELVSGARFTIASDRCTGDASRACITYTGLAADLSVGDRILLDDGRIELEVTATDTAAALVETVVLAGGVLASNKGVNVPGVTLAVDPITAEDRAVIAWACEADVDFIGQSFVRSADDVHALRSMMARRIPIVAKIEKHEAVAQVEAIVEAADAVMVARGDLGVETAPEQVPVIQRKTITAARRGGKPVVIATQMLESMTHDPAPTRAEASDVANAIFSRADAVMLSGETAVGAHPVLVVETMSRIASTAEEAVGEQARDEHDVTTDVQIAVSAAVCDLAADLGLAAIVPVTRSGATAFAVARHRPERPIVAVTPDDAVARGLGLVWGVRAIVVGFSEDTDVLLDETCDALVESGSVARGSKIAITAGRASRHIGGTDFILVREV
ncbi:MAG: pyruvate kinase [Coriobacteriia bacterium]|nr:pyruvate kinase [Coriobacteriia bacterium]